MSQVFEYVLVLVCICFVWFVITRIWVGLVDLVIGGLKKLFGIKEKEREGNWHVLEKNEKESGVRDGKK